MASTKGTVPLHIPPDIWQPLVEIRAQLDALVPGQPTPIEEALREIIRHYKSCTLAEDDITAFRKRSKLWKKTSAKG
jgi:hypothetical protein